jgi:hypothetical protein
VKRLYGISGQSRSGGAGGMHTVGYAGSQLARGFGGGAGLGVVFVVVTTGFGGAGGAGGAGGGVVGRGGAIVVVVVVEEDVDVGVVVSASMDGWKPGPGGTADPHATTRSTVPVDRNMTICLLSTMARRMVTRYGSSFRKRLLHQSLNRYEARGSATPPPAQRPGYGAASRAWRAGAKRSS